MIPIGDDNSLRKTIPLVTFALIALNVLVFFLEMSGGEEFILQWAFIPIRFLSHKAFEFPTIFTSMFMHAGIGHLVGNMLYLWIFGDNVEDFMGKIAFLIFYLACGIAATLSQLTFDPASNIPNVGASGAIAGVLGAYILLFPYGKVRVIFINFIQLVPAIIVIGFWFVIQFFSSVGMSGDVEGDGGVAYMAHIGGFIAGLIITFFLRKNRIYLKK